MRLNHSAKRPRKTPRARPAGDLDTRDRILDAAERVFQRRGTAAARTQDIADEAGVNKALLHYYHTSKESLAAEVFRRAFGQLFPTIFATLGSLDPLDAKVRRLVETYVVFLAERPYLIGYVVAELHAHPERLRQLFPERRKLPFALLQKQLDREAAAGRLRPISAEEFVVNLLALIVYPFLARPILTRVLQMNDQRFTAFIEERKRTIPEFFLNALRP